MRLQRLLPAVAIAAAFAGSSVAAYADDSYYIVQDAKTKHCKIVEQKPVGTEYTMVGPDGVIYRTRVEAETAMRTVKVCTTD